MFSVFRLIVILTAVTGCSPIRITLEDASPSDAELLDGGDAETGVPDGGVDAGPPLPRAAVAFASSQTVIPRETSSAAADAVCQSLARSASLPGSFIAWYGAGGPVGPRLAGTPGWVRTDGLPIARNAVDLASRILLRPMALDETGTDVRGSFVPVATGTFGTGEPAATCTGDHPEEVSSGVADSTGNSFFFHARTGCDSAHRLYCFEVGNTMAVTSVPVSGRLLFLSAGEFAPDSGIAAADALCNAEATTAGTEGTFVALLATSGTAIRDRVTLTSDAWVRPDGVQVATASEFLDTAFTAPPNVTLAGSYEAGATVWTGADGVSAIATETCGDWTDSGGTGAFGAAQSTLDAFEAGVASCSAARRVYCVQQA